MNKLISFKLVDIIAPTLRLRIITTPICALIALNTVANYYWAITVPPGFADEDIRLSGHRRSTPIGRWERWTTAPTRVGPHGSEFMRSHELEPARVGKCQKCGSIKPEVSCTERFCILYAQSVHYDSAHIIAEYVNAAC